MSERAEGVGHELLEVTMTMRALGYARVGSQRAMRLAAEVHRDTRWPSLLEARRLAIGALDWGALHERSRIAGLTWRGEPVDTRRELLARVEVVRDLRGALDSIEALGPHPVEQP